MNVSNSIHIAIYGTDTTCSEFSTNCYVSLLKMSCT